LSIVFYQGLYTAIDYDEAYNLQVVDNLSLGKGYSSYGALTDNGIHRFDPFVTTGPIVMLPMALVSWLTGGSLFAIHCSMFLFTLAYFAGIYRLAEGGRGRHLPAAAAVATALLVAFPPNAVLGEVAAAAAIAWSAWAVSKNKPLWAGLAAGAAVQIKLTYGLVGATILVAWALALMTVKPTHYFKQLFIAALAAITPTVLFEIYRIISLGDFSSYRHSITEFYWFLQAQKLDFWLDPKLIGIKLTSLYAKFEAFGWKAWGICAAVLWVASVIRSVHPLAYTRQDCRVGTTASQAKAYPFWEVALAGATIGSVLMLLGWITQSEQSSARQGLPFLLLFAPLFAALLAHRMSMDVVFTTSPEYRWLQPCAAVLCLLLLATSVVVKIQRSVVDTRYREQFDEQNHVAELIRQSGARAILVDGWWQNPEYLYFSKLPGFSMKSAPEKSLMVVQGIQGNLTGISGDVFKSRCANILFSSPLNLVCWPSTQSQTQVDLNILDWGPKSTRQGVIPNVQSDGRAELWFKINPVKPTNLGKVRVNFGSAKVVASVDECGQNIAVRILPDQFMQPGTKEVTITQLATGKVFPVGTFKIELSGMVQ
jgi:uncharacterized membrane protein YqjE